MFVSIHIPKTAGTSLGHMFDMSSGRRILYDYSAGYGEAKSPNQLVKNNVDFIFEHFAFLHGHFYYQKYADLLPNAKFVTCLRHPVDRTISHYRHISQLGDSDADWRTSLINDGEMDLVEFVKSDENMRRAMTVHMEGRGVNDYDYLFFTEDLARGVSEFSELFDFRFTVGLPNLNNRSQGDTPQKERLQISDAMRKEVFRLVPEEVELYKRAREAFGPKSS